MHWAGLAIVILVKRKESSCEFVKTLHLVSSPQVSLAVRLPAACEIHSEMCPSAASTSADPAPVPTTEGAVPPEFTPVDTHAPSQPEVVAAKNGTTPQHNPYAPRASDFLSNVRRSMSSRLDSADVDGLFGGRADLLLAGANRSRTGRSSSRLCEVRFTALHGVVETSERRRRVRGEIGHGKRVG